MRRPHVAEAAPFGAFAPPGPLSALRAMALALGPSPVGRALRSAAFRLAGGKSARVFDVSAFGGQRVRLHPADNIAEKRVFRDEPRRERDERQAIAAEARSGEGPFCFLDVGANPGLYTLAARDAARTTGRPFRAALVEPQAAMPARLRFNLAASSCGADEARVFAFAATARRGPVRLERQSGNLGATRVSEVGEGEAVEGLPLAEIVAAWAPGGIDVMEIDIEGLEGAALAPFFATEPRWLWPRTIVIEINDGPESSVGVQVCREAGYSVVSTTSMNAIMRMIPASS
ncbi:FkbM family methyltransferase [Rubrimonas sp.]|uniref:FkbM family methyltransferase n=1 Tax=Rubrimonas sp. TaxID=2036015 RepID=UPI002FDE3315